MKGKCDDLFTFSGKMYSNTTLETGNIVFTNGNSLENQDENSTCIGNASQINFFFLKLIVQAIVTEAVTKY